MPDMRALSSSSSSWAPPSSRFCNASVDKQSHVLQGSFQRGRSARVSGFWAEDIRRAAHCQLERTKHVRDKSFLEERDTYQAWSQTYLHWDFRMPFLGQDWRSPGQSWVKTEEGWKKTTADDKNNNVSVQRLVDKQARNYCIATVWVESAQLLHLCCYCAATCGAGREELRQKVRR